MLSTPGGTLQEAPTPPPPRGCSEHGVSQHWVPREPPATPGSQRPQSWGCDTSRPLLAEADVEQSSSKWDSTGYQGSREPLHPWGREALNYAFAQGARPKASRGHRLGGSGSNQTLGISRGKGPWGVKGPREVGARSQGQTGPLALTLGFPRPLGYMGARSLSPDTLSLKRPWQPLASLVLHMHRDVTPSLPEGHL